MQIKSTDTVTVHCTALSYEGQRCEFTITLAAAPETIADVMAATPGDYQRHSVKVARIMRRQRVVCENATRIPVAAHLR